MIKIKPNLSYLIQKKKKKNKKEWNDNNNEIKDMQMLI